MSLTPRISRSVPMKRKQPRYGDSKKHLAFIRSLPCCVCGSDAEAHHLLRADSLPKGTGRKNLDRHAIPLCPAHHNRSNDSAHMHGDDEAWLAGKGIDGRALADALWRVTDDYEKGLRIVQRAKKVGV